MLLMEAVNMGLKTGMDLRFTVASLESAMKNKGLKVNIKWNLNGWIKILFRQICG